MSLLVDLLRRGFSPRAFRAVLRIALVALLGSLITAAPDAAAAETYPSRPITLIVPYPAGGGVDAMARIVAERLSTALGKQVLVDNRGGGGGLIGTRAVARAAPDGYTLLLGHTGTIAINPSLYANPGYDPRRDFAPIGLIATIPLVLLAHPSLPAKTVVEVIAYARREPGKLNIGSAPIGTGSYMCAELFKAAADIQATVVPYKGTAPLTNDLVGGHVPVGFGVIPPALGNVQSGTLRVVAVTSRTRTKLLPDVPTFDESGLPGFYAVLNYGVLAPAGTPPAIVARLSQELRAALNGEEVRQRIAADGGDVLTSTADEYATDIDRDEKQWSALVRKLGLRVE
jgi:tripartite-type tricarboxylate transporter receptor subunit TctC